MGASHLCSNQSDISPGVWLYQSAGRGRAFVPLTTFRRNNYSGRRGAMVWDACAGGSFDNGAPFWEDESEIGGSRVGGFAVQGDMAVRAAAACGASFDVPGLALGEAYGRMMVRSAFTF